jgi:hypothetical protein
MAEGLREPEQLFFVICIFRQEIDMGLVFDELSLRINSKTIQITAKICC